MDDLFWILYLNGAMLISTASVTTPIRWHKCQLMNNLILLLISSVTKIGALILLVLNSIYSFWTIVIGLDDPFNERLKFASDSHFVYSFTKNCHFVQEFWYLYTPVYINVGSIFVRLEKIINEFYCIVLQKFILNAIYIFSCQDTISLSTYHHNFCLLHSMFLLLVHCRILFYLFYFFFPIFGHIFIINIPLITTLNFMFMKSSLFLDTHAYFNYKIISSHFQYKWRIFG